MMCGRGAGSSCDGEGAGQAWARTLTAVSSETVSAWPRECPQALSHPPPTHTLRAAHSGERGSAGTWRVEGRRLGCGSAAPCTPQAPTLGTVSVLGLNNVPLQALRASLALPQLSASGPGLGSFHLLPPPSASVA